MSYTNKKIGLLTLIGLSAFLISPMMFQMLHHQESRNIFNSNLSYQKKAPISQSDASKSYITSELSNFSLYFKLHETESQLDGHLNLSYFNADPVAFSQIPFHLYLSGMQSETRAGKIEIHEISLLDSPFTELDYQVDESIQLMWVNLTSELQPKERINFQIIFTSTLPDGGIDRANEHGDDVNSTRIFKASHSYPIPCVYDQWDGWNTDPYLALGDPFYSDMAFYDIFIEAPVGMIIASTGELLGKTSVNGNILHHYNPTFPVREMTFSASRYFKMDTEIINGVNVTTYFLPKSSTLWKTNALQFAHQALTQFDSNFGEYPYPTLNIVQEFTHYGGMEYPCQVYITQSYDVMEYAIYRIEHTIVHEIGHQWFYQIIGVDEVDWGFLDEGLVCWATDYHYVDTYYPDYANFPGYDYLNRVRWYAANNDFRPNIINLSVYECLEKNVDYWYVAYGKAPVIFEKLSLTLGPDVFLQGIQLFFTRFQFKIATLADFQTVMEEVEGEDLDWFFFPWFANPQLPKYVVTDIAYEKDTRSISFTVRDSNQEYNLYPYSQQLPIEILTQNGEVIYDNLLWINGTATHTIELDSTPSVLRIDFSDMILTQFDSEEDVYQKIQIETGTIPGFESSFLLGSSLLGLLFHFSTRKFKNLKKSDTHNEENNRS